MNTHIWMSSYEWTRGRGEGISYLGVTHNIHARLQPHHVFFQRSVCAASMCVTWLIHMCDMTHSHVWHDWFTCVTWLIHICDMTHSYVWHDAFTWVTWLIHMCDMKHSYIWHNSWLIHVSDMTHSHTTVRHNTGLIHTYECVVMSLTWMSHVLCRTRHDSFICVTRPIHMCNITWVTGLFHVMRVICGLIHVWHMTVGVHE